jgi:hypothetical protein
MEGQRKEKHSNARVMIRYGQGNAWQDMDTQGIDTQGKATLT